MRTLMGLAVLGGSVGVLGSALADIPPPPPPSVEERGQQYAEQVRAAGHPCPRVTRIERWIGPWAAQLEARELEPYVMECEGGARFVVADAAPGWRAYAHGGAPFPGEEPRPFPTPVVWRFR